MLSSPSKTRRRPSSHHLGCCGISASTPILLLFFILVIVVLLLAMSGSSSTASELPLSKSPSAPEDVHFVVTTGPTNYFLPSLPNTNMSTFDPRTTNFGLVHQSYPSDPTLPPGDTEPTDWQRFAHHLSALNAASPPGISHHVLFLSRHGQGYHNLAESYYGADAWDCHFAALDGDPDPDSNITWLDASLSKLGQRQAREQRAFWQTQHADARMPRPSSWWVSPMERACRTAAITHGIGEPPDDDDDDNNPRPIITVKELLRETNGIHTCDKRRTRTSIAGRFPTFRIEPDFHEHDTLWDPVHREPDDAHTFRSRLFLDDILRRDGGGGEYISVTAHSGTISALLRAVGHRPFTVRVGSAIAVFVRAERVPGPRPRETFPPGPTIPACVRDPLHAGLPGYASLKAYVESVEADVRD